MAPPKKLEDLLALVKGDKTPTVAVAAGHNPDTIRAIERAIKEDVVKAILVGDRDEILKVIKKNRMDPDLFQIHPVTGDEQAALEAVRLVRDNHADMLMKGLVKTPLFMRAILDKTHGLVTKRSLLSHVAVMEAPAYSKLLIIADAAIIPDPNLDQKVQILKYTIEVARAIGIELPKAALVSATETISSKVQSSVDAAVISAMAQRKQIQGAIVDGPLALDVCISPKHCEIKGLDSPINGEADILIFPNIETANTFYKCTTLLAHGTAAAIVVGTRAPIVLTSRADDDESKFYSIVLAARMAALKSEGK